MLAVGTALSAKFAAVTAPAGTMGGTAIKYDSVGVQNVPATPAIVVELPSGDVASEAQFDRSIVHDFPVYFVFDSAAGDMPRSTAVMLAWLGPLLDVLETGNALGLGGESGWNVKKSRITAYEPGQYTIGGQPYHAWNFTVRVWTWDNLAVTP